MKIFVTFGLDVSAYAEMPLEVTTPPSPEELEKLSENVGDLLFTPDWETENALRVVSVKDDQGRYLSNAHRLEPSMYDGGAALQEFLWGRNAETSSMDRLVAKAAAAGLIDPPETVEMKGRIRFPGAETLEVEFMVRRGATQTERDLAFFQGLAQLATIWYSDKEAEVAHG